jgi:hypothetical protein
MKIKGFMRIWIENSSKNQSKQRINFYEKWKKKNNNFSKKIETLYNILETKQEAICTTQCIVYWANLSLMEVYTYLENTHRYNYLL